MPGHRQALIMCQHPGMTSLADVSQLAVVLLAARRYLSHHCMTHWWLIIAVAWDRRWLTVHR
jgi:hypothetical protein